MGILGDNLQDLWICEFARRSARETQRLINIVGSIAEGLGFEEHFAIGLENKRKYKRIRWECRGVSMSWDDVEGAARWTESGSRSDDTWKRES